MQILNATGLHRKSGGAQWRDLRFSGPFVGMFFITLGGPQVHDSSVRFSSFGWTEPDGLFRAQGMRRVYAGSAMRR
jgi:hypothetical protein